MILSHKGLSKKKKAVFLDSPLGEGQIQSPKRNPPMKIDCFFAGFSQFQEPGGGGALWHADGDVVVHQHLLCDRAIRLVIVPAEAKRVRARRDVVVPDVFAGRDRVGAHQ